MSVYVQVSRHNVITGTATLARWTPTGKARLVFDDGSTRLLTAAQLAAEGWVESTPEIAAADRDARAKIAAGRRVYDGLCNLANLARPPWSLVDRRDAQDAHYMRLAALEEGVAAMLATLDPPGTPPA